MIQSQVDSSIYVYSHLAGKDGFIIPGGNGVFGSLIHLSNQNLTNLSHSLSLCSVWLSLALQEQQYAQWMAGCRLASKGKSLADSSFQSEIQSIRSFLAMQKTSSGTHGNAPANDESINTHSLVSPRYHKKYKAKQVQERWNRHKKQ